MNSKKVLTLLKNVIFSALIIFIGAQCTTEEELVSTTKEAEPELSSKEEVPPVASLTIDGVNTILSSTADCKKCTYVVPAAASIIDGKALGIKPGQAICLDNAIKYGNLTFINLEGEADNPITIAYGVNTFADLTEDLDASNENYLE